jgi:hypothetical protein
VLGNRARRTCHEHFWRWQLFGLVFLNGIEHPNSDSETYVHTPYLSVVFLLQLDMLFKCSSLLYPRSLSHLRYW